MLELVATAHFAVIARRRTRENWFGRSLARLQKWAPRVDWDDPAVRALMEPHLAKMRRKRRTTSPSPPPSPSTKAKGRPRKAFVARLDTTELEETLLRGLLAGFDDFFVAKRRVLATLLEDGRRRPFHGAYDRWMLRCVLPQLFKAAAGTTKTARYQRFPCVRVQRPGELTIGPHCDSMYDHCPSTINVVAPLTACQGTACLAYESEPGKEDWRDFQAPPERGVALCFLGGSCAHFTSENTTANTRVSIDARVLLVGDTTTTPKGGGSSKYDGDSYFATAAFSSEEGGWLRLDDDAAFFQRPDPRCGVPFLLPPGTSSSSQTPKRPKQRRRPPELLTWKEVDALYEVLGVLDDVLARADIRYVLVAGSLLGACRSRSILFCDDDVDVAVFSPDLQRARHLLSTDESLATVATFAKRPWPACDRLRPRKATAAWIDVFCFRKFDNAADFRRCIQKKRNGTLRHDVDFAVPPQFPVWHYDAPEAILRWPKEFFVDADLFPLRRIRFGSSGTLPCPRFPVGYLLRAFGRNVFEVFVVPANHDAYRRDGRKSTALPRGVQLPLDDRHFLPLLSSSSSSSSRKRRRRRTSDEYEEDDEEPEPAAPLVRADIVAALRAAAVAELRSSKPTTEEDGNNLRHFLSYSF